MYCKILLDVIGTFMRPVWRLKRSKSEFVFMFPEKYSLIIIIIILLVVVTIPLSLDPHSLVKAET